MNNHPASLEPLETRPTDDLEDEIAILPATIAAATYRLLCLIEELRRRGGWADPLDSRGFRSCAHWLSWRVGLSLGTARQYVRVARALPELPQLSEAFGRGEVSWSKVRAVTRVATPESEEDWLGIARAGTASHVEKLVRRYRKANVVEERDRALAQQESRRAVSYCDGDGMMVLKVRLPPEEGAVVMKALDVSMEALREEQDGSAEPSSASRGNGPDSEEPVTAPSGDQLRADALVRMAGRALDADAAGVSDTDRYQVVVHVDAEVLADPAADGQCALEEGPALAAETARRLACDSALRPLVHGPAGELTAGRKTRAVSTQLRRALRARDGTGCAFPGCTCRGRDAHHVVAWANGGATVLGNLVSLCKRHHTFLHEGGYRVEARPGGGFRFLRPDGRELEAAPALRAITGSPREGLLEGWVGTDVRITRDTGYPEWDGEPVDYDWILGCLEPIPPQGTLSP